MNKVRNLSTLPQRLYDVLIAGGGLIGSTMACALGKNPAFAHLKIGLIEGASQRSFQLPELHSNRVSSLNPSTKKLLTDLGIWQHIRRFRDVKNMKVWGSYSHNCTNFGGSDREVLAYIVENDETMNAITQELNRLENVDVLYNAKIQSVMFQNQGTPTLPQIFLEDDQSYSCKLLIGADGPASKIRKAMGVGQIGWNYNQLGVVATLRIHGNSDNHTAWQKFLPNGPIALLPLDDKHNSLVWSTTPEEAKMLLQLPRDAFVDAVNNAIMKEPIKINTLEYFKGALDSIGKLMPNAKSRNKLELPEICDVVESSRAAFPLAFSHSAEYVVPHVVIIGDAAHRVHPLAGQGVNLGFRDVEKLTKILSSGLQDGRALADTKDLRLYESLSQKSNIPIMASIDLIHRIYTSNKDLVQLFGNIGFSVAEIHIIKELMKNIASH